MSSTTTLNRPIIVCLCGSGKFPEAFQVAMGSESLDGKIVLTIGVNTKEHDAFRGRLVSETTVLKAKLDILHLAKIDLADEVLVLNVAGYIGESTLRELLYARMRNKRVRFLEPDLAPE